MKALWEEAHGPTPNYVAHLDQEKYWHPAEKARLQWLFFLLDQLQLRTGLRSLFLGSTNRCLISLRTLSCCR